MITTLHFHSRRIDICTPEEYQRVFDEGVKAYQKEGKGAISPYLSLNGYQSIRDAALAGAWESGWWKAVKDEAAAAMAEAEASV